MTEAEIGRIIADAISRWQDSKTPTFCAKIFGNRPENMAVRNGLAIEILMAMRIAGITIE